MKKNKGFTVVEMIVSFSVTMIIMVFMFELVILVKDLYVSYGVKTELLTKQAIISEKINGDLLSKDLLITAQCGSNCIDFYFSDNTKSRLKVDRNNGLLQYGDYTTKLVDGSSFGNIKISTQSFYDVTAGKNDSILSINIPIYHKLLPQQNHGVSIAYQYKSYETAISDAHVVDNVDRAVSIRLVGSADGIAFSGAPWSDPGYYVAYDDGTTQLNDPAVTVTGSVGTTIGNTYTVTYTLRDSNSVILSQVTRKVKLVSNTTVFNYNGGSQTYVAPVSGIYKLEVWGAQGGTTDSNNVGGKGGYTVGQIELKKDDMLVVNVGGQGNTPEFSDAGFNGGGQGGQSTTKGSGGGGATDIRYKGTALSNRIIVAGGGGGAANSSSGSSVGGVGGGSNGGVGSSNAASYNGGGASSTSGGARPSYTTSITTAAGIGTLGQGGAGGVYNSSLGAGGGGGGYYGGAGGVRLGVGGGGSGYCGTLQYCTTSVGTAAFKNVAGTGNETGHAGHGNAKITLLSITNVSN